MTNNPIEVGNLAIEIFMFDHTFMFSDDYKVWQNGEIEKNKLIEKAKEMNFSTGDKILIITLLSKLWNNNERYYNDEKPNFESTNENSILWPLKSSMYEIAGITKKDLLFSPIQ